MKCDNKKGKLRGLCENIDPIRIGGQGSMKSSQRRDLRPEGRMGVTRLDGPRKERGEGKTGRGKNMAALGGERRCTFMELGRVPRAAGIHQFT